MKKYLSLLLCAAMLLSLAGCGGGGTPTTVPTDPTVPPTTVPAGPDPALMYAEGAEKIENADSLLVTYTIEKSTTAGTGTFEEEETVTLSLLNPGQDSFTATASRDFDWDGYIAEFAESYGEGNLYSVLDGMGTSCAVTPEAYMTRYLPAVLLSPELYGTVELEDADTILFSDAFDLEPWLDSDLYELVEASGSAELTASGELGECTYHVVYTQGGIQNELDITLRARIGSVDVKLPEGRDQYLAAEHPDAIVAYERAVGLTYQAKDYITSISSTVAISAGALAAVEQSQIYHYGEGPELAAQYDYNYVLTDLSGQYAPSTYTEQHLFKDGVYSFGADGDEAQSDSTVTPDMMTNFLGEYIGENFLLNDSFQTANLTDLGAVSLLEFTFTEAFGKDYGTWICGSVYEDENLLNNLASAYRTDTGNYYIGIDNATGLPTMVGIEYMGTHTIDGSEYPITAALSQNYSFGTGESYKTVMGKPLPVDEPEEKAAPLLYRVTGADGGEMYLFGTIHVGDGRMAYLPQSILDALSDADALAVEFDSDSFTDQLAEDPELAALIQQYYFYTDGTTTAEHISDELLYRDAMQLLKASGGYLSAMEMVKPVILYSTLENTYLELDRRLTSANGAESHLMAMAREQGKEILNVESAESQIAMLTGYSDELQTLLVREILEADPAEYQAQTWELYQMWCRGDEAELAEYLSQSEDLSDMTEEEQKLYEEYTYAMSTKRNAEMLEVAKGYLSGEQVVFYAVGLAHLLAQDGLVNTLRDAGYTVELVPTA